MRLSVIVFCFLLYINTSAQTLIDFARCNSITWYGIDFSKTRFINFRSSMTESVARELVQDLSADHEYNNLLSRRFDKIVYDNLQVSETRNNSINYDGRIVNRGYDIDIDTIRKIVSEYRISGKGYGVLFVVEGLEYTNDNAFVWAVFIDESKGFVISAKRFNCNATNGSLEKRWTGAIRRMVKYSGDYVYSFKE